MKRIAIIICIGLIFGVSEECGGSAKPQNKCEIEHSWIQINSGLIQCVCDASNPPDCICEPKTQICYNCGLMRWLKITHTEEWIYK